MKIKRILAMLVAVFMVASVAACGPAANPSSPASTPDNSTPSTTPDPAPADDGSITLWTYPIGNWGQETEVKKLTDAFTAETGIAVKVDYLAYADGDDKVNAALSAGNAPDLILEGPERLVANWGANGHMVDLKDMFDETDLAEINGVNEGVMKACTHTNGAVYEYPLVMTAHCMAINKNAFEEAGALQYVDLENHTWTTENFIKAVEALSGKFDGTVGAVFCKGQGGDQGTRVLVNNLYGGTFTDAAHTKYTWDDPKNIEALQKLKDTNGIEFDASLEGGDEIAKFYQGILKMAFCWNIAQQLNPNIANTGEGLTQSGEEIAFMSFPSQDGTAKLNGGIWGFGVFDNGDATRIENAKKFIKYMADSAHTVEAVKTANYFPVRSAAEGTDLSTIWADNKTMNDYQVLMPFLGDYYQVTKGWAGARTAWWNMLQKVGAGEDIATVVAAGAAEANAAAAG